MSTEERIVLTAELKDELTAPLNQIERRVEASTRRMGASTNRSANTVSRSLRRIGATVSQTFTTTSSGLRRIAGAIGGAFTRTFSLVGRSGGQAGNTISSVFGRMGGGLRRVAGGIRTTFQRVWPAISGFAQRAVSGISTMMQRLGSAAARAGQAMAKGFGTALTKIASVAKRTMDGIAAALTAVVGAAALGASTVITRAVTTGLDRAKVVQDTVASGKILIGSEKEALDLVTKLKEVVTGTPFTLPDFAKAGMDLVAFGVSADKVPGIMRAIGEASAGRGEAAVETARSLALNMAQMSAVGQVSMDDVLSFQTAGVDALAILGNYFGKTSADMKEAISDGLVPADKAIDVLTNGIMNGTEGAAGTTKALAGTMKELRKTVSGSWGALMAGIAKMGTVLWDPDQTGFSGLMGQLPALFNSLNTLASAVGDKVFKPLGVWIAKMGFIPKLTAWVDRLVVALSKPTTGGWLDKLKEMAPALGVFGGLLLGMVGMALSRLPLIGGLFKFINIPLGIFLGLLATSPELRSGLGAALKEIWIGLKGMGDALKPLMPMFSQMATILATELVNVLNMLVPILVGLMPTVAQVFLDLGGAVLDVVKVLAPLLSQLIGQLAPVLGDLIRQLLPVFVTVLTSVLTVAAQLAAALLPFVSQLITMLAPILGDLITSLLPLFLSLLNGLAPVVLTLISALAPLAIQLVQMLIPPILQIVNTLLPVFVELINTLAPVVVQLITALMPLVEMLITRLAPILLQLIMALFPPLMTVISALAPIVVQLVEALIPLIPPLVEIMDEFMRATEKIMPSLLPLITKLAQILADVLVASLQAVMPLIELLLDWLVKLLEWAQGPIGGLISMIADNLKGMFEWIPKAVGGIGDLFKGIGDQTVTINGNVQTGDPGYTFSGSGMMAGGGIAMWNEFKRAAGGTVLPGYAPGVDTEPYLLSKGESVLVPELTRQLGPESIMAANRAASAGRPAGDGPVGRKLKGGGGGVTIAEGAIQQTFTGGNVDYAEVKRAAKDALHEVIERKKREY